MSTATKTQLHFGADTRDISPSRSVWMAGYANRTQRSQGVLHPVQVNALALATDPTAPFLLLTFDLVGIHVADVERLARAVAAATGVDRSRLMIACSHTHFAPSLGPQRLSDPALGIQEADESYVAETVSRTVEAAQGALRALRPGLAEVLRARVPHVHFNRRLRGPEEAVETHFLYPSQGAAAELRLAPTDDELVAVRFRREDSATPSALFVNFACHPVTGDELGQRQSLLVSADYVHYLRQALAQEYGCPVSFTQGAAGDVVPMRRLGSSRRWIGESLAAAVFLGERAFRPLQIDSIDVRWDELSLELREEHRRTADGTDSESAYLQAQDRMRELRLRDASVADADLDAASAEAYEGAMATAFARRSWPEGVATVRLQTVKLGPLALVAFPFEVLAEIGLQLKTRHPEALLISCANGYEGYLPTEHDYSAGGYESSARAAFLAPGAAERLLDAGSQAVAELLGGAADDTRASAR